MAASQQQNCPTLFVGPPKQRMPFTFPEDMTMESYESYRPARAAPPDDPLGMAGQRPAGGHSHDEEDKIDSRVDNTVV
jgi:hypothetical protein